MDTMDTPPQRFHEKALANGLVTSKNIADLEREIAAHITGNIRANAIDVKCFIHLHKANPDTPRSNAITRWNLRNCDDLHQASKGKTLKGPVSIIESRLGVLTRASGLVNRTHQKTDDGLALPDSQFKASDLGLTDGEWAWLCIPGKPNAFAQGTGIASKPTAASVAAVTSSPPSSSPLSNSMPAGGVIPNNGLKRERSSDDDVEEDDHEPKSSKRPSLSHDNTPTLQPTPPLSDIEDPWSDVLSGQKEEFINPGVLMPQNPSEFGNATVFDYMTPATFQNTADAAEAARAANRYLDDVIAGITEIIGDRRNDAGVEQPAEGDLNEQDAAGDEVYERTFEELLETLWEN